MHCGFKFKNIKTVIKLSQEPFTHAHSAQQQITHDRRFHNRLRACPNTQAAFAPLLQEYHSAMLAWDRVHPNLIGHQVLAQAFLDAVEY